MKTKIFVLFLVITFVGETLSYAAPGFFKKKSEKQVAAAVSGAKEANKAEEAGEPLTKEEQEEIFQEQKDLKDLKDSDRVAKEGANTAVLSRSLSNRPSTPQAVRQAAGGGGRAGAALAVVRAPERPVTRPAAIVRPVGNPNGAVARAPERPAQNPNSQVARAPERPARR